jgi:hypothetical protein
MGMPAITSLVRIDARRTALVSQINCQKITPRSKELANQTVVPHGVGHQNPGNSPEALKKIAMPDKFMECLAGQRIQGEHNEEHPT